MLSPFMAGNRLWIEHGEPWRLRREKKVKADWCVSEFAFVLSRVALEGRRSLVWLRFCFKGVMKSPKGRPWAILGVGRVLESREGMVRSCVSSLS
ncbi:hypothetical protein F511_02130 [Dorcoceras hygrometricum]|nr:hypothetical protein F511_02130 [Dorcoceras hygrometricum]